MSVPAVITDRTCGQARHATGLQVQISLGVSFVDPRTGVTVPFGATDDQGRWAPLDLNVARSLDRSTRDGLIEWLIDGEIAGQSVIANPEEATRIVAETRQRCLLLAEQNAPG